MLARPLGGMLFGYMGDFLGRRKALSTSMYGIALATIAIGLTPTYATIGGLTSIVENFLYQWKGNFAAIALWLILIGMGTLESIVLVRPSKNLRTKYVGCLITCKPNENTCEIYYY